MAMETQREVAEYFRSLELALNEQEKKGTPKGDPTYSRIYTQLARDISQIGIARLRSPKHVRTLRTSYEETCPLTEDASSCNRFSSSPPLRSSILSIVSPRYRSE